VATPYKIHLEAYDGPLDLLLDLIRKQEMDIHNIPIAQITGQYLDYLHKLEQLDVDVSADFIYMAATLILIKSKMLLPPDPLAAPEEQIDPRAELVQRLVEHEKFKNAAQLLYERQQLEAHVWSKPERSLYEGEDMEGELVVSLVDLVRVFQQVLERRKEVVRIELHQDEFTVKHHDGDVAPAAPGDVRGGRRAGCIFRRLPRAFGDDLRAAGRARTGPPAGGRADAERNLRRHLAAQSTKCSTRFSALASRRPR
jgi:chromatin segregation and condensation protein Rec8/ScpA/Scc1 (kleisin family)